MRFEGAPAGQVVDRTAAAAQAARGSGFGLPHGAPPNPGGHTAGQRTA